MKSSQIYDKNKTFKLNKQFSHTIKIFKLLKQKNNQELNSI